MALLSRGLAVKRPSRDYYIHPLEVILFSYFLPFCEDTENIKHNLINNRSVIFDMFSGILRTLFYVEAYPLNHMRSLTSLGLFSLKK